MIECPFLEPLNFSLSKSLALEYKAEIQRLKENHKSEVFILQKQVEGLKQKLIDMSSLLYKTKEGVSITVEQPFEGNTLGTISKAALGNVQSQTKGKGSKFAKGNR